MKINLIKNILICFFIYLYSLLKGDIFSDSALPTPINKIANRSEVHNNTKSMFYQSINISNIDSIEGAMIVIDSDFEPIVKIRFYTSTNEKTDWLECKSVNEPFSFRWFSGKKIENLPKNINKVEFEVTTGLNQSVDVKKIGLFIHHSEQLNEKKLLNSNKIIDAEVEKPRIITRSEWGARAPQSGYSNMPYYDKMTLHHSAGFSAETLEEGIAQMQAIQLFHQDIRGWSDIGYHFVVDKAGNIYQGRPETVIGAHTGGSNTGNIGTCVLGCYHPPASDNYFCYDEITTSSKENIIKLLSWTSQTYNISPFLLKGHRDYYDFEYTSCPGNNLWILLPQLRQEIEDYKNFGPTPNAYKIYQNFPNPFNDKTEIQFDVVHESKIEISIYNILGKKVKTLTNENYNPGKSYTISWNGRNNFNELVSSGVYICYLKSKNYKKAVRMVFLK